jgi:hypothetical protein
MAANDLMLFYRSEEQNREKMANTASRMITGIMRWTLGLPEGRARFTSIFLASSFLCSQQNPRPPQHQYPQGASQTLTKGCLMQLEKISLVIIIL